MRVGTYTGCSSFDDPEEEVLSNSSRRAKKALFTNSLSVKLKELQRFEVEKITNFQKLILGKNFVEKKFQVRH